MNIKDQWVIKIPLYRGKTVEEAVQEVKTKEGWKHVTYSIEKGFQDGRAGKPDIVIIRERVGRCLWADNEENCGHCEYFGKEEGNAWLSKFGDVPTKGN